MKSFFFVFFPVTAREVLYSSFNKTRILLYFSFARLYNLLLFFIHYRYFLKPRKKGRKKERMKGERSTREEEGNKKGGDDTSDRIDCMAIVGCGVVLIFDFWFFYELLSRLVPNIKPKFSARFELKRKRSIRAAKGEKFLDVWNLSFSCRESFPYEPKSNLTF